MEITHNNKTYRPSKYSTDLFYTLVESYIKSGDLEEVKENKEPDTPQFTPWQVIEVSNDEKVWWKAIYKTWTPKAGYYCLPIDGAWLFASTFARPLQPQFFTPWQIEQVAIPELPEETKKLMCDFADWYHNWLLNRDRKSPEEEITRFLHSQFPNSKANKK